MENNILKTLTEVLEKDENFVSSDGILLKNIIRQKAENLDEKLISLLLDNETLREKFFIKIKDVIVFDNNKFIKFINNKEFLPDSYTSFKNKIGLTNERGDFIASSNEVVLNFPFKDCVLAGGQDKEDQKRDEIFYNEILGQDDIDRLFDKKVFTNFKRIDKDGEHELEGFKRDENGDIKDNLIIKGNNLLALHSLKSNFAGKVKLIYIDPPYNTGSDSFKYNDKFNHSTWLTFMKNRLEVAKVLLRDDGVIFISCDDNEYTYLKVLLDGIDGIKCENIFHIKVRHENRILRQDNRYQEVIEQCICYSKSQYNPLRIFNEEDKSDENYKFKISIKEGEKPFLVEEIGGHKVEIFKKAQYELIEDKEGNLKEYNIRGSLITQSGSASEFYELNLRKRKEIDGYGTLYKVLKMGEKGDGIGYRFIRQPFDEKGENGFYYQGKPINKKKDKGNPVPNFYDFEKEFNRCSDEGGVVFKNGKKPEKFLDKIFEISQIKKGDLFLDYHLGSASSCAVAHKKEIQYIGIEQMDYIEELSVIRLKNVINGDDTGISKIVNWKGGGDFVYMELMQENHKIIEKLKKAKNISDLEEIYENIKNNDFINYKINPENFDLKNISEEDFENFGKFLLEIIDKNLLYKNFSEINDKTNEITDKEKNLNNNFYNN